MARRNNIRIDWAAEETFTRFNRAVHGIRRFSTVYYTMETTATTAARVRGSRERDVTVEPFNGQRDRRRTVIIHIKPSPRANETAH